MTVNVFESLRKAQMDNIVEGILYLYRAKIYSVIDSALALDASIDSAVTILEQIIREEYE